MKPYALSFSADILDSLNRVLAPMGMVLSMNTYSRDIDINIRYRNDVGISSYQSILNQNTFNSRDAIILKSSDTPIDYIHYAPTYTLVYTLELPFNELPLYVNSWSDMVRLVLNWRLEHNK